MWGISRRRRHKHPQACVTIMCSDGCCRRPPLMKHLNCTFSLRFFSLTDLMSSRAGKYWYANGCLREFLDLFIYLFIDTCGNEMCRCSCFLNDWGVWTESGGLSFINQTEQTNKQTKGVNIFLLSYSVPVQTHFYLWVHSFLHLAPGASQMIEHDWSNIFKVNSQLHDV